MKQKVFHSNATNEEKAVEEISAGLKTVGGYNAVLFCASVKYDFERLSVLMKEAFPDAEVLGTSTCGEISPDGFTNNGIVAAGISCPGSSVKGIVLDKAHDFLYIRKNEIRKAATVCGIREGDKNAFALVLINALFNAEENVLAVLHAVLGDEFPVVGGSAGDDLQFKKTYVSCNGKAVFDGVAILFVKTNDKFKIVRENIFRSTGKSVNITEADPEKRIILSIDNKNPTKRYAEILGVSETELKENMEHQMMGRIIGQHIFVSSMQSFNPDGTINLYSRILPNTPVEVLEVVDPLSVIQTTCDNLLKEIPNPGVVFMANCIQRTIRFKNQRIDQKIRDKYNACYKNGFIGFTSYGEQINRIHSNSTLVTLAVEE